MKKEFPRVGARDIKISSHSYEYEQGRNTYCPCCGYGPMDGVTSVEQVEEVQQDQLPPRPEVGDITICLNCAEILQVGENYQFQLMTDDILATIDPEQTVFLKKIQEAVRAIKNANH